MIKNDYRRALIMLRPNMQGYSGHIRLERRTLMGSMYFIVNTPDTSGDLRAALVGKKNDDYYVAPIGALRRDRRGQASLPYSFDPRNIDGRELEDYQLAAVVRLDDGACQLVLTGNLNGSHQVDYSGLQRAICETYEEIPESAQDLPSEEEKRQISSKIQANDSNDMETPTQIDEISQDSRTSVHPGNKEAAGQISNADDITEDAAQPLEMKLYTSEDNDSAASSKESENDTMDLMYGETATMPRPSAADILKVDVSQPWAAAIEGLRTLFANEPAENAFEDDEFVYVRASLPMGSGYEYAMIGLHETDGRIDAVRYAIPARYTPEPPVGLESYIWTGDADNGWWVLTVDPQTGEPLENIEG